MRLSFHLSDLLLDLSLDPEYQVENWGKWDCQPFKDALQNMEYPDRLFEKPCGFQDYVVAFGLEVYLIWSVIWTTVGVLHDDACQDLLGCVVWRSMPQLSESEKFPRPKLTIGDGSRCMICLDHTKFPSASLKPWTLCLGAYTSPPMIDSSFLTLAMEKFDSKPPS